MIRAILFDMNGIIVDDEHIHERAFRETVKSHGIDLTHKKYLECCAGKTDTDGYEAIAKHFSQELLINKLLIEKKQTYLKLFPKNKKSYDGVLELIKTLSKDYILALTSSSSRAEVDLITKEFGVEIYFETTVSADDVMKGKPDPEPYLITAKRIGLSPKECCVIEDSKSGVLSAKNAGCYCIGVTTTHDKKDLITSDIIVESFSQINKNMIKNLV